MKKLLLLLLIAPVLGFSQGEQRYADGTATDQDGNTFEWINYGDLDWSIENAKVVTYRDGTPIRQAVTNDLWSQSSIHSWCYSNNDSTKRKLYNWFAIKGVHDNDSSTPNKEFAPIGWRVATDTDWINLENYLIENGYNFDGSFSDNKIAKAMSSTDNWDTTIEIGAPGYNKNLNNTSGFNAHADGFRTMGGSFGAEGDISVFWTSTPDMVHYAWVRRLSAHYNYLIRVNSHEYGASKYEGYSVRFVRDASTASVEKHAKAITVYPNPTSSTIEVQQEFSVAKVYSITGQELLKSNSKTIDLSELPSSVYLLRLYDNSNKVLGTTKVVKL